MKLFSYDKDECDKYYNENGRTGIKTFFKNVLAASYRRRRKKGRCRTYSLKEAFLDFIYHYCAWKAYLNRENK